MTSSVTLRTKSGKWQHTTTLDDPIFSDILAPYIDLGETPEEVLLTGSVGEVIESNWGSWEKIETSIDKTQPSFACILTPSLIQFATLLNLPAEWILFVGLDRSKMSYEERIEHYKRVGALILEKELSPSCDQVTHSVVEEMREEVNDEETEQILLGAQWEGILTNSALGASKTECALLAMDWESFSTYLNLYEWDEKVTNTAALLLGKGELGNEDLFNRVHLSDAFWLGIEPSLLALYKTLMRNLEPDMMWSPSYIGFGDLVHSACEIVDGALRVIWWVHRSLIDTDRSVVDTADLFWRVVGRDCVERIVKLLTESLQFLSGEGLDSANAFLARATHHLEQEP